jgi:holo-[acyl-carrier protein] synthase
VINLASGAPSVVLWNKASEIAEELGIMQVQVSISHCKAYATAFAIGLR